MLLLPFFPSFDRGNSAGDDLQTNFIYKDLHLKHGGCWKRGFWLWPRSSGQSRKDKAVSDILHSPAAAPGALPHWHLAPASPLLALTHLLLLSLGELSAFLRFGLNFFFKWAWDYLHLSVTHPVALLPIWWMQCWAHSTAVTTKSVYFRPAWK